MNKVYCKINTKNSKFPLGIPISFESQIITYYHRFNLNMWTALGLLFSSGKYQISFKVKMATEM